MKRYQIRLYKRFDKARVYTIHEKDAKFCETDLFFLRFKDQSKYQNDIEIIIKEQLSGLESKVHWNAILGLKKKQVQYR